MSAPAMRELNAEKGLARAAPAPAPSAPFSSVLRFNEVLVSVMVSLLGRDG